MRLALLLGLVLLAPTAAAGIGPDSVGGMLKISILPPGHPVCKLPHMAWMCEPVPVVGCINGDVDVSQMRPSYVIERCAPVLGNLPWPHPLP